MLCSSVWPAHSVSETAVAQFAAVSSQNHISAAEELEMTSLPMPGIRTNRGVPRNFTRMQNPRRVFSTYSLLQLERMFRMLV